MELDERFLWVEVYFEWLGVCEKFLRVSGGGWR